MNNQREVVYTYRNEVIDTEDPHKLVYEVIDEAVPAKVLNISAPAPQRRAESRRPAPLGKHHFSARPNERQGAIRDPHRPKKMRNF